MSRAYLSLYNVRSTVPSSCRMVYGYVGEIADAGRSKSRLPKHIPTISLEPRLCRRWRIPMSAVHVSEVKGLASKSNVWCHYYLQRLASQDASYSFHVSWDCSSMISYAWYASFVDGRGTHVIEDVGIGVEKTTRDHPEWCTVQ